MYICMYICIYIYIYVLGPRLIYTGDLYVPVVNAYIGAASYINKK